jgi:hypothetical protein
MLPGVKLSPWPYDRESRERVDGLDFSVKIQGPTGWFDLEDGDHYAIHGESFSSYAQTWRKREVNTEWIEGSFPVSAVRENVTEPLVVYVRGNTFGEGRIYRDKLIAAVEQLSWMLMVRFGDVADYWQCWASDYTVETQREFLHAMLAVVRVTVSRLPAKQTVDVTSDLY